MIFRIVLTQAMIRIDILSKEILSKYYLLKVVFSFLWFKWNMPVSDHKGLWIMDGHAYPPREWNFARRRRLEKLQRERGSIGTL